MSAFISVNTVGLYANYSMIVSNIQSIVSQLISSLSGSLGNLIHTENSSEKATIILKKYQMSQYKESSGIGLVCVVTKSRGRDIEEKANG